MIVLGSSATLDEPAAISEVHIRSETGPCSRLPVNERDLSTGKPEKFAREDVGFGLNLRLRACAPQDLSSNWTESAAE